jgi:hypothetical protein
LGTEHDQAFTQSPDFHSWRKITANRVLDQIDPRE